MVSIQIKGGTLRTADTLCRTCSNAQIIKGFSATEEEFFCGEFYPKRRVPFAVSACTSYADSRRAALEDMKEIAWLLTPRKSGRGVGFLGSAQFREQKIEEAQAARANNKPTEPTE